MCMLPFLTWGSGRKVLPQEDCRMIQKHVAYCLCLIKTTRLERGVSMTSRLLCNDVPRVNESGWWTD